MNYFETVAGKNAVMQIAHSLREIATQMQRQNELLLHIEQHLSEQTKDDRRLTMESIATTLVRDTPVGELVARPYGEPKFPGIAIFIRREENGETVERMLTLVEYTADEAVCGYDPQRPLSMERERQEVSKERMAEDGQSVTPGIITRSWEKVLDDDSDHKRTIHIIER